MLNLDEKQLNYYIKVANYYYKNSLTQNQIAKKMKISRQKVNRILKQCIDLGIVKISIKNIDKSYFEISSKLESRLNIDEIIIVPELNLFENLASELHSYLSRTINKNDTIGFTKGKTLSKISKTIKSLKTNNVIVTQLLGNLDTDSASLSSENIVRNMSKKLNAKANYLYVPLALKSQTLKDSILDEDYYRKAFNTMYNCNLAVVGIGDMIKEQEAKKLQYISEKEYRNLISKKVVGEVCTHFFDVRGNIVKSDISDRTFTLELEKYLKIKTRIGIAGGPEKKNAVLGAVRSGLINCLITDISVAEYLLKFSD